MENDHSLLNKGTQDAIKAASQPLIDFMKSNPVISPDRIECAKEEAFFQAQTIINRQHVIPPLPEPEGYKPLPIWEELPKFTQWSEGQRLKSLAGSIKKDLERLLELARINGLSVKIEGTTITFE